MSLDNVNDGVIISDANGNVTITNIAARLMLDLSEEQSTGWKLSDLFKENEHLLEAYYKYAKIMD